MFVDLKGMFLPKTELPSASHPSDLSRFPEYLNRVCSALFLALIPTSRAVVPGVRSVVICLSPSPGSPLLQKSMRMSVSRGPGRSLHAGTLAPGPGAISSFRPVPVRPGGEDGPAVGDSGSEADLKSPASPAESDDLSLCDGDVPASLSVVTELPGHPPPKGAAASLP